MKHLLTGNEAAARGAYEAGVHFASAYPGTPSTEILENISKYQEIHSEWAPNEKVALEAVVGAQLAGARSLAAMKHVGLNVAADPLFSFAYTGVNAGTVIITADEPGQFSSQDEQDNRNYAKAAMLPMFEPADSQESKEMLADALDISEQYDVPVLYRMTTRVCHSKSLVEFKERREIPLREYTKNVKRTITVPANSRPMKVKLQKNMALLKEYSNRCQWNRAEYGHKKLGIICSGDCYMYAREVFGDDASYLKIGFSNPLPDELIREFAGQVEELYIIEENDPYMEEHVRAMGIACKGKDLFPSNGEMIPEVIRQAVFGRHVEADEELEAAIVARPPTFCAGCPHRGFFYELGKRKNVMVTGDIGCYTLGFGAPYNAMDTNLCMGASISMGHGAQQVFNKKEGNLMRVVGVIGDSTFFHTGINSLLDVVYNRSNMVTCILDNRITAMTGQQENPGTGLTAMGEVTEIVDMEALVRACGIKHVRVINPNELQQVKESFDWALSLDEPSVIITRWPCALKKQSEIDRQQFPGSFSQKYRVDEAVCIGCKKCTKTGCPAIVFQVEKKKSSIDQEKCIGCSVCAQVCPVKAIVKAEA
ncbi:MAG: indolepyruvate ferredoxin oxidoreductase subunit alpha [Anaerolineaceae bacterium]|nr:indolepyruvate ferredoxin oxidoreductase subunit alpha [Anaerolineaceae bacterium]